MKFNLQQVDYLKGITSKKKRKKIKKEFIDSHKAQKREEYRLLIDDILKVMTNPLFLKIMKQ
jgi:hypothetical protein